MSSLRAVRAAGAAQAPVAKLTMPSRRSLSQCLLGSDAGVRRLLLYWSAGLALYTVSLAMLWCAAALGVAPLRPVAWLSVASVLGAGVAYATIRASVRLHLSPTLINTLQSTYAMACVIAAYALLGPMRGFTISILTVVLVFGGFSSTPRQLRAICIVTVTMLGLTMLSMSLTESERYLPQEEMVNFIMASAMLAAVTCLAGMLSRLRRELKLRRQELADALARIQDRATHDELTQLANRRKMLLALAEEAARRDRSGQTLCVAVIDLDHVKRINDTLGDAALRQFAEQAQACVRRGDLLARWGGEEFLVLLPRTDIDAAQVVLERIRTRGRAIAARDPRGAIPVTFSAGVAESPVGEAVELAIERADVAMYRAKREGRDCVLRAAMPARLGVDVEQPAGRAATDLMA